MTAEVAPAAGRSRHVPVRTCLGCRQRRAAVELLRVVASPGAAEPGGDVPVRLTPDPRARAAGRGAWVHPDQRCVQTAVRRRSFARALRVSVVLDPSPLLAFVQHDPSAVDPQADASSVDGGSTPSSPSSSGPET